MLENVTENVRKDIESLEIKESLESLEIKFGDITGRLWKVFVWKVFAFKIIALTLYISYKNRNNKRL